MTTIMHPHANPQQHHAGEQRRGAFQQLTLGAADIDQVSRHCPGSDPGEQRQAPANVHTAHRLLLSGVTQEGENRRQHQNRLQPLAQQNQQAGEEAQAVVHGAIDQQCSGLVQLDLGLFQRLRRHTEAGTILQRLPIGHQGALGGLALHGIEVVESAFDQFETFQIGADGEVISLLAIALAISLQATLQGGAGVADQLLRAALLQQRMRALSAERGDIATGGSNFGRRAPGQLAHGKACLALRRSGGKAGDVTRQIPALTLVELIGESRHIGAFDAQTQGVVEVIEAEAIHARRIAQIGRRRLQADAGRPVAQPGVAMAHRALLGVKRRTALRIRRQDRRQADLIELGQTRSQCTGSAGNFIAGLALGNGLMQIADVLLQLGATGLRGQGDDQSLQYIEKFQLLLVLAGVDDLAVNHSGRIIGADITDQMQRLSGAIERLANGEKTETGQQRQDQPGKREAKMNHQCIPNENGWH